MSVTHSIKTNVTLSLGARNAAYLALFVLLLILCFAGIVFFDSTVAKVLILILPTSIVLLVKFPRIAIVGYTVVFYCLYLIMYSKGGLEGVKGGALHYGEAGSGYSLNFAVVILLIMMSIFYLMVGLIDHRNSSSLYFKNPGSICLTFFLFFLLISLLVQTIAANEPLTYVLRKGRDQMTYPFLAFLLWFHFKKPDDDQRLLKWALFGFFVVVVFGLLFNVSTRADVKGGVALKRLGGIFFGPNNTAALLSTFLPFLFYIGKLKKGSKKILWYSLSVACTAMIVLTFTRAALVALSVAGLVLIFIEGRGGKVFLYIGTLAAIFVIAFFFLDYLFLDVMKNRQDTFDFRVKEIWQPSIEYSFGNYDNYLLYFGSPQRSFNEVLEKINGINIADHNMTIRFLILYGMLATVLWIFFWVRIIWSGITTARRFVRTSFHRNILVASTLSLVIFFVMAHSASVTDIFYLTPVFVIVFLLWKSRYELMATETP